MPTQVGFFPLAIYIGMTTTGPNSLSIKLHEIYYPPLFFCKNATMPSIDAVKPKVFLAAVAAGLLLLFFAVSHAENLVAATPRNLMGINIIAPLDWSEDRLYANVMLTSRSFINGLDVNDKTAGEAPVDANGWPTSDFSFYVWADIDRMDGTYTITFEGRANVSGNPVGKISIAYNPETNTSKGTFHYTKNSSSALTLRFADTKRTPSSPAGSGVTSIKLLRPLAPGARQSYPSTTLFADPLKALIAKFSVIRFMDFLATNSNIQKNWSDRPLPSWPSFHHNPGKAYGWQGTGGPWEHVILLANETGKDAWINIPVRATDAYVKNVALMFAYGSDGVNPYTAPQKNPVYPPLNANLKIYVEYSNELWNSAPDFQQTYDNCQAASDELASTAGNSPLNWDKSWNSVTYIRGGANPRWNWPMCFRRIAKRSVEISNIFREVFGDATMAARIRPELMSQLGNPGGALFDETKMMLEYYNNMGGNFVTTPHPPNYFFYGAGGSGYYSPKGTALSLDTFFSDPGMTPEGFTPKLQEDAKLVAAMGLKRIAYEGGPSLFKPGVKQDSIAAQAVNDPRMTRTLVNMHNAWSSNGGDLLVYFTSAWDYEWGFTSDIYNLSTPKLLAIDALNAARRAPLSFGTQVPGSADGKIVDACSRPWDCNRVRFWDRLTDRYTADGSKLLWASYTFRSSAPASWKINLSFSNTSNDASAAVYVDGVLIGTQPTTGQSLNFNAGSINAGLHGVIVRALTGTFSLDSVSVAIPNE